MYCGNCGQQIPDESKFCPKCGNKTSGSASSSNTQLNPQPPPQVVVIDNGRTDEASPIQHAIGTIVLVIGIIALVSLFFNMILAFVLGVGGDILGIFGGKSSVAKVGQGICGFVTGACIVIWILAAIGIASCLGYFA